jgi:hypothetical protein
MAADLYRMPVQGSPLTKPYRLERLGSDGKVVGCDDVFATLAAAIVQATRRPDRRYRIMFQDRQVWPAGAPDPGPEAA